MKSQKNKFNFLREKRKKPILKRKRNNISLSYPINGSIVPISELKLKYYLDKYIGESIAMRSVDGKLFSPLKFKVENIWNNGEIIDLNFKELIYIRIHLFCNLKISIKNIIELNFDRTSVIEKDQLIYSIKKEYLNQLPKITFILTYLNQSTKLPSKLNLHEKFTTNTELMIINL